MADIEIGWEKKNGRKVYLYRGSYLTTGLLALGLALLAFWLLHKQGILHQAADSNVGEQHVDHGYGSGVLGQTVSAMTPAGQQVFFDSPAQAWEAPSPEAVAWQMILDTGRHSDGAGSWGIPDGNGVYG